MSCSITDIERDRSQAEAQDTSICVGKIYVTVLMLDASASILSLIRMQDKIDRLEEMGLMTCEPATM
jgi:hypothetical protein